MNLWLRGRGGWKGTVRGLGKVMHTLLYLKWITNKDALYSPGNATQCRMAAWMGAGFGGEWTRGWVPESLCCSPETTVTQSVIHIQTYKLVLVLKKKKKTEGKVFFLYIAPAQFGSDRAFIF